MKSQIDKYKKSCNFEMELYFMNLNSSCYNFFMPSPFEESTLHQPQQMKKIICCSEKVKEWNKRLVKIWKDIVGE